MYAHHIFGIFGMSSAMASGYALVAINNLVILTESSTLFLNYRVWIYPEEYKEFWPSVNSLLFFVMYTVSRILFLPYLYCLGVYQNNLIWNYVTLSQKISVGVCVTLMAVPTVLNYFWYYKICRGLGK